MTREGVLMREIQIAASEAGHRLLRNNVGVLKDSRNVHVRYGLGVGSSDLIGWTRNGLFAAVEVKVRPRKATKDQLNFVAMVKAAGGRACIAYTVEQAMDALNATPAS